MEKEKMSIEASDVATISAADLLGAAPAEPKRKGPVAYMVRHQSAGIITSHVFTAPPTDAQMAPVLAEVERLHGKAHPKTEELYWTRVMEVPLLDGKELPVFPKRAPSNGSKENAAGAPKIAVSGVGTVVNPVEK